MMFVSQMAFFAKVSDKAIGGTYMTFFNTLANLGGKWAQSLSLWMLDFTTVKHCEAAAEASADIIMGYDEAEAAAAAAASASASSSSCEIVRDGYYYQVAFGIAIGIVWLRVFRSHILSLEDRHPHDWIVYDKYRRCESDRTAGSLTPLGTR
eukprot:GHVU01099225.1.p1 GENE.GHVU01099225.1~~GHVU01099225.1.p1  ORF type:complete len:152 (-),score=32.71 GHVU01099225.1:122-577(-)